MSRNAPLYWVYAFVHIFTMYSAFLARVTAVFAGQGQRSGRQGQHPGCSAFSSGS